MSDKARRKHKSDDQLALLVAAGRSVRDAAAEAQVSEATAYRRAADPDFQDRVRKLRAEMFEQAVGQLAGNLGVAAQTLLALLGPETPPRVRLGAAKEIIAAACSLRTTIELEARIAALEQMKQ